MEKAVVLFDGVCNFCDSSVQFIMKHDYKQKFQFASIQSETGAKLVEQYGLQGMDSVFVIANGEAYVKADAPLYIVRHFKMPWKLFVGFKLVPRRMRNVVYDYIAKNRYKWFGKKEACRIPTQEERERFLP
jgi:predicted DCC family thiol-disulfide oxidoreductase YuxK